MPTRSRFDRGQDGDDARPELAAQVDPGAAGPSPEPPSAPVEHDLAGLGEHVGVVLAAAESAAETLLIDAEREAQRVRQAAAKEAEELREQVAADAEADLAEARRQLTRAKEEARVVRAEADAYAESRKAEAAAQARRVLGEAEQRAAEIVQAAASRQQALQDDISVSQSQVHEFALSLTEAADRLEEISQGKSDADAEADLDAALQHIAEKGS